MWGWILDQIKHLRENSSRELLPTPGQKWGARARVCVIRKAGKRKRAGRGERAQMHEGDAVTMRACGSRKKSERRKGASG